MPHNRFNIIWRLYTIFFGNTNDYDTPEDFKTLAKELETLSKKLAELNEEELALVAGGHRNDNAKKD